MATQNCPYCSSALLRHARQKGVYWFCMSCWQEVPLLSSSTPRRETRTERSKTPQAVGSSHQL